MLDNNVNGWCPVELGAMLNRLVSDMPKDQYYLEIGTFCGRSLAFALHGNKAQAIVIDPLDLWTEKGYISDLWNQTVDSLKLRDRVSLHMQRSEDFVGELPPIGIFFYDGNHDSGHTYEALNKYSKFMAPNSIVVVDDYNIHGGDKQTPFPGHEIDIDRPVKTDVDRWILENKARISHTQDTLFLNHQMFIHICD